MENKIEPRLFIMVIVKHNSYNGKFTVLRMDDKEELYEGHPNEILKYCMINNYDIRFGG